MVIDLTVESVCDIGGHCLASVLCIYLIRRAISQYAFALDSGAWA
jgi:hypothetical protein